MRENSVQHIYDLIYQDVSSTDQSIDPARTLDEQPELLPYHQFWEFPRNQLKLGSYYLTLFFKITLSKATFV